MLVLAGGLQGCAIFEGVGDALVRACEQPSFNTTKFADTNDGICTASDCSLREAVITANACSGEDTINLAPGTYMLELRGPSTDPSGSGDLVITEDLIFNGNSAVVLNRDLLITGEGTRVSLSEITLHALRNEGFVDATDLTTRLISNTGEFDGTSIDVLDGIGIINEGTFSITGGTILRNRPLGGIGDTVHIVLNRFGSTFLNDVVIAENSASPEYEGEFPELRAVTNDNGDIELNNVIIRDNNLPFRSEGAAFWNGGGSTLSSAVLNQVTISGHERIAMVNLIGELDITDSHINDNLGGALFNDFGAEVVIRRSLISGNGTQSSLVDSCGSLSNYGSLTLENSTITGSVDSGIGCTTIENWAQLVLDSTTMYGNALTAVLDQDAGTAATRIERSILANNLGGNCISSVVTSSGYNLFDDGSCSPDSAVGDIVDSSGMLAILPLADNGGPTFTHALLASSPAIDSGGSTCLPTDQRGYTRPAGRACDIGAFEKDAAPESSASQA
jgi:CSLREA domain-containing protein